MQSGLQCEFNRCVSVVLLRDFPAAKFAALRWRA